jgi:hypothetical protein
LDVLVVAPAGPAAIAAVKACAAVVVGTVVLLLTTGIELADDGMVITRASGVPASPPDSETAAKTPVAAIATPAAAMPPPIFFMKLSILSDPKEAGP